MLVVFLWKVSMEQRNQWSGTPHFTEDEMGALEKAGALRKDREGYEEAVGLAAALRQSGFSMEEICRYFKSPSRAGRMEVLSSRRWNLVESMHDLQRKLGRIDYLLFMERSGEK